MKTRWTVLSVVGLALLATLVLDLAQGEAFDGTPDWSRTTVDGHGQVSVWVEWEGDSGFVVFPESMRGQETLPIRVSGDSAHIDWINSSTYLLAGAIGLLLGLVVDFSLRGHGYVRGKGGVSETPDLNVGEERGYYWRT